MNLEEFFSLFNSSSKEDIKNFTTKITSTEDPTLLNIRMFKDYILMFDKLKKELMPFLSLLSQNNSKKVDINPSPSSFNIAFTFLKKVNLEDKQHYDIFCKTVDSDFIKACDKSLNYYVEIEDYEKCAVLKKFIDEGTKLLKINLSNDK
jgi:hypothetical protein